MGFWETEADALLSREVVGCAEDPAASRVPSRVRLVS